MSNSNPPNRKKSVGLIAFGMYDDVDPITALRICGERFQLIKESMRIATWSNYIDCYCYALKIKGNDQLFQQLAKEDILSYRKYDWNQKSLMRMCLLLGFRITSEEAGYKTLCKIAAKLDPFLDNDVDPAKVASELVAKNGFKNLTYTPQLPTIDHENPEKVDDLNTTNDDHQGSHQSLVDQIKAIREFSNATLRHLGLPQDSMYVDPARDATTTQIKGNQSLRDFVDYYLKMIRADPNALREIEARAPAPKSQAELEEASHYEVLRVDMTQDLLSQVMNIPQGARAKITVENVTKKPGRKKILGVAVKILAKDPQA